LEVFLSIFLWILTYDSLAPVAGEFELISGFPPKAITNVNQTVEEAGLEDSKVIQKLL